MKNILIVFGLLFSVSVFSQGANNDTSLILKYDKYIFINGDEKDINDNVEGGEVYMDNDVYTIYYNFLKTSDLAVFNIKKIT